MAGFSIRAKRGRTLRRAVWRRNRTANRGFRLQTQMVSGRIAGALLELRAPWWLIENLPGRARWRLAAIAAAGRAREPQRGGCRLGARRHWRGDLGKAEGGRLGLSHSPRR